MFVCRLLGISLNCRSEARREPPTLRFIPYRLLYVWAESNSVPGSVKLKIVNSVLNAIKRALFVNVMCHLCLMKYSLLVIHSNFMT